jgi:hypothetical protein
MKTEEVTGPLEPQVFHNRSIKCSVPSSQETHCVCAKETNQLMLFGEIVAVYSQNQTKRKWTQYKMQNYLMLMQVVCIITTVISRVNYSILFKKVAEAATHLTFIGHVPGSNLGRENKYPG